MMDATILLFPPIIEGKDKKSKTKPHFYEVVAQ